jgi:cobalt-zinc-cadmium efflux system protein
MGVGHGHDVATGRSRALTVALGLNVVIVLAQVVAGIRAHSLGLLADAGHNLVDVAAILLALTAVRWSRRAPTTARSYGYHRATILAALANAVLIVAVTGWLVVEGVSRLDHPPAVRGGLVAVIALAAAVVNILAVLVVRERGSHDLNLRAVMLHLVGDVVASLAVAAAGLAIWFGGPYELDPVASLVVAVLIGVQAIRLVRDSADVLLESTPSGLDVGELVALLCTDPGVVSVHDLHVWSLSSDMRAMSAHVLVSGHPTLEQARVVGDRLKARLAADFAIGHATLELECETCDAEPPACLVETSPQGHAQHAHGRAAAPH